MKSEVGSLSMLMPERAIPWSPDCSRQSNEEPDESIQDELLTIEDLQGIFDCCYNTARKKMTQEEFPSFKENNRWYVTRASFREYLHQMESENGNQEDEVAPLDLIAP